MQRHFAATIQMCLLDLPMVGALTAAPELWATSPGSKAR